MTAAVVVGAGGITPADVVRVARELATVELTAEVEQTILASRAVVERAVSGDRLIYGLNTGLGHMRDERVPLDVLLRYQRQMIEAHASGIGAPLDTEDVRAAMLARVSGAARGGSGLTLEAVQLLVAMLNAGVHPIVPSAGSVGAGDLMHMAAIAVVMIGRGEAELNGEHLSGAEALAARRADADRRAAQGGARTRQQQRRRDRRGRDRGGRRRSASRAWPISPARSRSRPRAATRARGTRRRRARRRSPGRSLRRQRCGRCSKAPTCTTPRRCSPCRTRSRSASPRRSTAPSASS